ncbi:MAG: hypothetical protein CMG78_09575 [Marinobacter sp.]|nr:hypothetical protein [Marinobacter sp.]|tara:strand:- start:5561 stop:6565 length:1005 start_codon:yes stop_codon:yes gene_type:complete
MTNRRRLQNRLAALLAQYDGQIQAAFLEAIRSKANSINLTDLANAIEARELDRALRIAGITRADLYPFDSAISSAYVAGGQTIAAAAPAFAVNFGFDGRADRAERWARDHVGQLVTNIVEDQAQMLRETIGNQLAAGVNPRQTALDIAGRVVGNARQGGFIGLTRAQAGYLANARAELENLSAAYFERTLRDKRFDALVRKAIADGKPLSKADIDRIASRYSDRLLKHRADMIARTESITALRAGRREGIEQAIEAGAIRAETLTRVWDATLDARTRPDHVTMHGTAVEGLSAPFVLPDGSRMMYPGDTSLGASASQTIMCRCYEEHRVDWLRG